jgi:hypothetical protein
MQIAEETHGGDAGISALVSPGYELSNVFTPGGPRGRLGARVSASEQSGLGLLIQLSIELPLLLLPGPVFQGHCLGADPSGRARRGEASMDQGENIHQRTKERGGRTSP